MTRAPSVFSWAIDVASRTLRQWTSASMADLPGGPRGYFVLASVAQDRPRSQLALALQLGIDKTAMTYLLDELEVAGLVERRPDPADRRQRQIVLTPLGLHSLSEFGDRFEAAEDRLLSSLTSAESVAFREMLERVARSTRLVASPCAEEEEPPCP
ncbi:MAG: transcriptional regulator, MarR family [Acidimicrobiaceae bacterium]|jgi:DNA-binding MarR family transcriptional regulator|nr:transcriptional regulator, MarR family [Acidimicrobiaceae bacterium]